MTGLETAEYLAVRGNRIMVCEMLPQLAPDTFVYHVVKTQLALAAQGVAVRKNTQVTGIEDGYVLYHDLVTGIDGKLPAEVVVMSLGVKPDRSLLDAANARFENVVVLGDTYKPGNIPNAVSNAFHRLKKM